MKHDIHYAEVIRLQQIDYARKLQAKELSRRQMCEASWCGVIILFLTLIVGWFA